MQIIATQIRVGMILDIEGDLYKVTYTQHVTPGKGVACMQTKLKNVVTGKNLEKRFRSADKAERANLETRQMQYLYADQDGFIFMDNESYEQTNVPKDLIGDQAGFLAEEQTYAVSFYEETIVGVDFPPSVVLKVVVAPPEIKKATAAASLRPVEVENGMSVNAPSFIKEGDLIRVNTETGDYIERAK
ncbi:elongation factor P [bacterium]|jgi:elongation factor P|nr:elongation factor P [bacterium]